MSVAITSLKVEEASGINRDFSRLVSFLVKKQTSEMKLLVLFFFGAAVAQQHHQQARRVNYQQAEQFQNVEQQEPQNYQPQPQQPQQFQQKAKNFEEQPRLRHETTTYIPIIRFDKEQGNDGSYKTAWETGNNILAQEEGYLKSLGPNPDKDGEELNAQVQQGSYSYTSPEGQLIQVTYTADETGFHPSGDHLPTPPPVSPEVQKGLDLIYAGIRAQQENAAREAANPSLRRENQVPQEYQNNNNQYRQ